MTVDLKTKKDKTDLLILEKFTTTSCQATKIVSYYKN